MDLDTLKALAADTDAEFGGMPSWVKVDTPDLLALIARLEQAEARADANEIYADAVVQWRPIVERCEQAEAALAALKAERTCGCGKIAERK